MKKTLTILSVLLLVATLTGCSNMMGTTVTPTDGSVARGCVRAALWSDATPAEIEYFEIYLTTDNSTKLFVTKVSKNEDLVMEAIPVGTYLIHLNAFSTTDSIVYSGSSTITVNPGDNHCLINMAQGRFNVLAGNWTDDEWNAIVEFTQSTLIKIEKDKIAELDHLVIPDNMTSVLVKNSDWKQSGIALIEDYVMSNITISLITTNNKTDATLIKGTPTNEFLIKYIFNSTTNTIIITYADAPENNVSGNVNITATYPNQ